jgi:hypothetical protein
VREVLVASAVRITRYPVLVGLKVPRLREEEIAAPLYRCAVCFEQTGGGDRVVEGLGSDRDLHVRRQRERERNDRSLPWLYSADPQMPTIAADPLERRGGVRDTRGLDDPGARRCMK